MSSPVFRKSSLKSVSNANPGDSGEDVEDNNDDDDDDDDDDEEDICMKRGLVSARAGNGGVEQGRGYIVVIVGRPVRRNTRNR